MITRRVVNMSNDSDDVLSAEELRKRLHLKFQQKGILDKIKSQLRNNIISELDGSAIISLRRKEKKYKNTSPLLRQMINWLVVDHLKIFDYNYTLSVFVAESRTLSETEEIFTFSDILNLLHVKPDTNVHRSLLSLSKRERESSLLLHIFNFLGFRLNDDLNKASKSVENWTQTENLYVLSTSSVQEKLRQVEDLYLLRKNLSRLESDENIEMHLFKYKTSLEDKLRKEMKAELRSFQDREILSMRIEEREKCQLELKNKLKELDRDYQSKLEALIHRERKAIEDNNILKENLERETFNQRQDVFNQLDQARQQELEARRLAEKTRVEFQMESEKQRIHQQKIAMRENELNEKDKSIDILVRDLVTKERFIEREEYSDKLKNLQEKEILLMDQREKLEIERLKIEKQNEDILKTTAEITELRAENNKLRTDLRQFEIYKDNSFELEQLKPEFDSLHRTLTQTKTERDSLRIQVETLNDHLRRPSSKMINLTRELEKIRDSHRLDQAIWNEQRNRLQSQLNLVLDHNRNLSLRVEEQTEINSRLNKIVRNLSDEFRHDFSFRHPSHYRDFTVANLADTFFDTSLNATRLPPELELHGDSPAMYEDVTFFEDPRHRLIALEKEAEHLEKRFRDANFKIYSMSPRNQIQRRSRCISENSDNSRNSRISPDETKLVEIDDQAKEPEVEVLKEQIEVIEYDLVEESKENDEEQVERTIEDENDKVLSSSPIKIPDEKTVTPVVGINLDEMWEVKDETWGEELEYGSEHENADQSL